jgi:hypothetical protein
MPTILKLLKLKVDGAKDDNTPFPTPDLETALTDINKDFEGLEFNTKLKKLALVWPVVTEEAAV